MELQFQSDSELVTGETKKSKNSDISLSNYNNNDGPLSVDIDENEIDDEKASDETIQSIRKSIMNKRKNKIQNLRNTNDNLTNFYNAPLSDPNNLLNETEYTKDPLEKTWPNTNDEMTRVSLSKSRMSTSASNKADSMKDIPRQIDTMKRVMSTDCLLTQRTLSHDIATPDPMGTSSLAMEKLNTVQECLQAIRQNDWESKIQGLSSLESLAVEKPQFFIGSSKTTSTASSSMGSRSNSSSSDLLNQAIQLTNKECKNLRSQVSKQAVQTLGKIYRHLPPKYTDSYLEMTILTLTGKIGEASSGFLKDEVTITMETISEYSTPIKVLQVLLQHGIGHKNVIVRKFNANYIANAVEKIGPNKLISSHSPGLPISAGSRSHSSMTTISSAGSQSSLTEKLFNAIASTLKDGNQDTRSSGKRILAVLQQNPDFEKAANKYLAGESLRNVHSALDNMSAKGIKSSSQSATSFRRAESLNYLRTKDKPAYN